MGAGVSLSLSRNGVHGESICSSFFSLISGPFPREHGFYVGSVPFARKLSLSQISSLRCLEEIDSLFHKKDSILLFGFRSHLFPCHREAGGLSSVMDAIHRVFLGQGSPQSSEPGVNCMKDIVLPMPWVPDLFFSSLRAPMTGTMGLYSYGSPLGSPDPIMLTPKYGLSSNGRMDPVFIGENPVLTNRYEKACSRALDLGLEDSRVPVPGGNECLRLDSIVDGQAARRLAGSSNLQGGLVFQLK